MESEIERAWIAQGAQDARSRGRTLGHKRLYCAQCASNADIGKLLVPSPLLASAHPQDRRARLSVTLPDVLSRSLIRESITPDI